MIDLSHYLQKFKNIVTRDSDAKELVQSIIQEVTHVVIPVKQIEILEGAAHLKGINPTVRAHIFMHKERIQKLLEEKTERRISTFI